MRCAVGSAPLGLQIAAQWAAMCCPIEAAAAASHEQLCCELLSNQWLPDAAHDRGATKRPMCRAASSSPCLRCAAPIHS